MHNRVEKSYRVFCTKFIVIGLKSRITVYILLSYCSDNKLDFGTIPQKINEFKGLHITSNDIEHTFSILQEKQTQFRRKVINNVKCS